jgi:sec-independent protein translocase protein TatA
MPLFPMIGVPELLIVLVVVLVFFGAGKLPQVMRSLGEGMRGLRSGISGDEED